MLRFEPTISLREIAIVIESPGGYDGDCTLTRRLRLLVSRVLPSGSIAAEAALAENVEYAIHIVSVTMVWLG